MNKVPFSKVKELLLGVIIISLIPGVISSWLFDSFLSGFISCFILFGIMVFFGTYFIKDEPDKKADNKIKPKDECAANPADSEIGVDDINAFFDKLSKEEKEYIDTQFRVLAGGSARKPVIAPISSSPSPHNNWNSNSSLKPKDYTETVQLNTYQEEAEHESKKEEDSYPDTEKVDYSREISDLREEYNQAMNEYQYYWGKYQDASANANNYHRYARHYADSNDVSDQITARGDYETAKEWEREADTMSERAEDFLRKADDINRDIDYLESQNR